MYAYYLRIYTGVYTQNRTILKLAERQLTELARPTALRAFCQ